MRLLFGTVFAGGAVCAAATGGITIAYLILIGFGISSALKFQQKQLPFIGFLAVRLREMVDSRRK